MASALVESYPHRRAGHCGSGALRDLLEFHGLSYFEEPLSEGFAFGLSGGFGFHFFELPELEPPLYLVGRTADLERGLCSQLGIELDLRQTDDAAEGWRWLRGELDRGRPTMVWADIKHLDYLRVRLHNTMHDVVVVGYDEEEGVARIADNDRDVIQRCSLESLARARNSPAFPGPNRHATWVMEFPGRLPPVREAIAGALASAVANMRGAGAPIGGENSASGLAGVAAMASGFPHWPERFQGNLPAALAALRTFIVKAGTGGAMFRSLQADFLHEAALLLDDAELAAAGRTYSRLSQAWRALAEAVREEEPLLAVERGLPHVEEIARLEREGVAAMERSLEEAR